jgi:hypothetical protein
MKTIKTQTNFIRQLISDSPKPLPVLKAKPPIQPRPHQRPVFRNIDWDDSNSARVTRWNQQRQKAGVEVERAQHLLEQGINIANLQFLPSLQPGPRAEAIFAKLPHPVMIIDCSNYLGSTHKTKEYSHIAAAEDLHQALMRAKGIVVDQSGQAPVPSNPDITPEIEIILILEKWFTYGVKDGLVGDSKTWLRTVHAPWHNSAHQNIGDDTLVSQAEWAAEAGCEVVVVTEDLSLKSRVEAFGCRTMTNAELSRLFEHFHDGISSAEPSSTTEQV